jgi:putative transposase
MVSVPARRQQVAYGRERGLSARRACTLFSVARSALEYRSRKGAKDAPVVTRLRSIRATAIRESAFSSPATAIA